MWEKLLVLCLYSKRFLKFTCTLLFSTVYSTGVVSVSRTGILLSNYTTIKRSLLVSRLTYNRKQREEIIGMPLTNIPGTSIFS